MVLLLQSHQAVELLLLVKTTVLLYQQHQMEVHLQEISFVPDFQMPVEVVVELLQPAVWVYLAQQPEDVAHLLLGPAVMLVLGYVLQSIKYK
jgi:hypothetical protein